MKRNDLEENTLWGPSSRLCYIPWLGGQTAHSPCCINTNMITGTHLFTTVQAPPPSTYLLSFADQEFGQSLAVWIFCFSWYPQKSLGVTQLETLGCSGGSKIHVSIALAGMAERQSELGLPVRAPTCHHSREVGLLTGSKSQEVGVARLLLTILGSSRTLLLLSPIGQAS